MLVYIGEGMTQTGEKYSIWFHETTKQYLLKEIKDIDAQYNEEIDKLLNE